MWFDRIYYRRTEIDKERDFNQETIKKPSELGYSDWQTRNGKMVRVIKIDRRYFYTKYMVKIQVFNDMCQEPLCEGPISNETEIMSAEDLPQVINGYKL